MIPPVPVGPVEFRRIVLDLRALSHAAPVLRRAAELARLLRLDLRGLYFQDPALALLAGLAGVRELRLPVGGWETLDAARLAVEAQQAAARAGRLLAEIAAAVGVPSGFETRHGSAADIITNSEPTDILLLVEPPVSPPPLGQAFAQRCLAAYRSMASLLLLPAGRTRMHGAIVAALMPADVAGLAVAARIAQQAGEDLVLLVTDMAGQAEMRDRALACGVRPAQLRVQALRRPGETGIAAGLAGLHPRLLVLTRGSVLADDIGGLLRLSRERAVPILVVEPP